MMSLITQTTVQFKAVLFARRDIQNLNLIFLKIGVFH